MQFSRVHSVLPGHLIMLNDREVFSKFTVESYSPYCVCKNFSAQTEKLRAAEAARSGIASIFYQSS